MVFPNTFEPIDYLMIGHITRDITPGGFKMGGTAAYSSLMAQALGLKVGILTSWGPEVDLTPLKPIPITGLEADHTTTFENIETENGRAQKIHHLADSLDYHLIPDPWRGTPIVHVGPIAQEVEPTLVTRLETEFIGLTPQGWLREWDEAGKVRPAEWPEARIVLNRASATVISDLDIDQDYTRLEDLSSACELLIVTRGEDPLQVYWKGEQREFSPPKVQVVDSTGAGDIFATVLFIHYYRSGDPWESTVFAMQLASQSLTRAGLNAIPTQDEIRASLTRMAI